MKKIYLSQQRHVKNKPLLLFTVVDDSDYEWLSQWKWYFHKGYAVRKDYDSNGGRITLRMHRVILGLSNRWSFCDHIDGNGLNNQRLNLRIATPSQNAMNRKSNAGASSKYLGVFKYDKGASIYWKAQIKSNNILMYLGHFKDGKDAAMAYNEAAKRIHGEFARLNII